METDSISSDREGTLSWDDSSDISPSETISPQPEEETEKATSNIRTQLKDCLENIHDGRFAASGALPNAANPGIFVPSLGLVGLPLSSRDAEAFVTYAEQVQSVLPISTVSLSTGSWSLMPDQFDTQNPVWQQTLAEAIERTSKALGLTSHTRSMKAEIAQLRICRSDDSVNESVNE